MTPFSIYAHKYFIISGNYNLQNQRKRWMDGWMDGDIHTKQPCVRIVEGLFGLLQNLVR